MSEVALLIGGRTYRVACAPGEEERVSRLGATIAQKLETIGNPGGTDAQNLLFAALLLADEALEGREAPSNAGTAGEDLAQLRARVADLEARAEQSATKLAEASDALSEAEADAIRLRGAIADLEAERDAPPSSIEAAPADLSALAPALEHFAEMLEQCADKLESRTPSG